jgi:hypothetical protein
MGNRRLQSVRKKVGTITGRISFSGTAGLMRTGGSGGITPLNATGLHFTSCFVLGEKYGVLGDIGLFTPVNFADFEFKPPEAAIGVVVWTLSSGQSWSCVITGISSINPDNLSVFLAGTCTLRRSGLADSPGTFELHMGSGGNMDVFQYTALP